MAHAALKVNAMPLKNPRVSVVLERDLRFVVARLANVHKVPLSVMVRDLVREDEALASIVKARN